jgi:hypothetical protein
MIAIMKKKAYIQPMVNHVEMMPQGVICTSGMYGGSSENAGGGQNIEVP